MKKILYLPILCLFLSFSAFAQSSLKSAFENAYTTYPLLPKGSLEALAYANTRMQNVAPIEDMDHHHGPNRFGLFGLVEDGEGYFKDNLKTVCQNARISPAMFKASPELQIMAVANYLNDLCKKHKVKGLNNLSEALKEFSEIPAKKNDVSAYANELYAYEVFHHLKNGFETAEIGLSPQNIEAKNWFSDETYELMSSPKITIKGQTITNGKNFYKNTVMKMSTDYAPALWVASPNYSSRSGTAISAVTVHTVQGTYAGCVSWFQNTSANASAHYVVRSSDGQITQMVLETDKAWHVGSENPYTVGIEHEGYVTENTWYTTAMYSSSAALVRDICTDRSINPTTCYSGASSSVVQVLASSVKIKGHQHYPNQTHTDPGIYWNWSTFYNLVNNTSASCGVPSGLTTPNITPNSIRVSWAAVTGASSYSVQYKLSAASTWTTVTSTSTALTLTGLTANSIYNIKVAAVCSTTSAYSTAINATTLASSYTTCTGTITDSGNTTANYGNSENYTYTIAPTGASSVSLTFNSFGLESGYDFIYIYNGTTTSAPLIGTYSATSPGTVTANSGAMTLRFVSDGATVSWGFSASWTCSTACGTPTGTSTASITSTSAVLNWTAVSGAGSYTVQVKPASSATWSSYTTTTNSYTASGLTASTAYNWQVKANCGAATSTYSPAVNFSTIAPPCNAPTTASSSNISTSTATLSWTAVSGATGYTVEWKTSAATTWSTAAATSTTHNLSGLVASTVYNYRVKTTCSGGSSAYTATGSFTTQASCWDANESNNTSSAATAIATGTSKIGKICASGDVDWFKITTTAASSSIVFTATQLPMNYNIELYVGGTYTAGSYNTGTTNESITRTSQPAGTYYYRVYGATSTDFHNTLDYKVSATVTPSIEGIVIDNEGGTIEKITNFALLTSVYPNPVTDNLSINIFQEKIANLQIKIMDSRGVLVRQELKERMVGEQILSFTTNDLTNGLYFLQLQSGETVETLKFVVQK